jgi:hypothetical protein
MTTEAARRRLLATGCPICAHTAEHGWHGLTGATHCSTCHATHGGKTAHCTVCHETFSAMTAFDLHRSGGACRDPASVGLRPVPDTHGTPVWREIRTRTWENGRQDPRP